MGDLKTFKDEITSELYRIMSFWNDLKDEENGGFYGYVSQDLEIDKNAEKGAILHSRIMWFYSNVYLVLKEKSALSYAKHAYEFFKSRLLDTEFGGVYWMVDFKGNPTDDMKHTYNQAFAIYALSSYYLASGEKEALQLAYKIFNLIESKCTDKYGYMEAFDRSWKEIENDKLSEDGYMASKTMNTLLHVIEAYTELYRTEKNPMVGAKLKKALLMCEEKVYDKNEHILGVFFDKEMNLISDIYSFGHDIEAAWLLDLACKTLGDDGVSEKISYMLDEIAEMVKKTAFDGKALNNQRLRGEVDATRIWWVQAESVVGFLNAYQRTGNKEYLDAALLNWDYIKENICDKRKNSEWFWAVDQNGVPISGKPIVEPWKCPYHNGRMCMEVIKRYDKL